MLDACDGNCSACCSKCGGGINDEEISFDGDIGDIKVGSDKDIKTDTVVNSDSGLKADSDKPDLSATDDKTIVSKADVGEEQK